MKSLFSKTQPAAPLPLNLRTETIKRAAGLIGKLEFIDQLKKDTQKFAGEGRLVLCWSQTDPATGVIYYGNNVPLGYLGALDDEKLLGAELCSLAERRLDLLRSRLQAELDELGVVP